MEMSNLLFVKSSLCIRIETDVLGELLRLLPLTVIVVIPCWLKEKGKEERRTVLHTSQTSTPAISKKGKYSST